ncbi:formate--tetrahydrofolate ligase [Undibacterium sp. LX40W]|uniref:Formate--tetrahydrofolate ligase n=1 Tax=Undibacterium nitidum TaxID=2762298 RepID=A0A923KT02_9BURK|nr:formate--tetrahydrofolate ligase [Undibacterium nitidum]MBC3880787.1 formate--tetrahydrofolate ligase [Undibacterium nitidum]MBC3890480.1 formate--tetrahydrofolate ligase [Undibacterium sp. LX40W]
MATKEVKSDLEIAQAAQLTHINEIAKRLGVDVDDLEHYGKYKAKLPLHLIDPEKIKKNKLVLVTAITPTPPGEGKTTTSIGLTEGLNRIGKKATVVLREPSLGPVFGIKGGAAGGGYSQVVPMEDINLHFTGDFSAIEKANNLLAALIDNNIYFQKESLGIDPRTVKWKRVMDMNDRSLRSIITGLGGRPGGNPREAGFNITAASEIMAILCLAESFQDLKTKLGNIYVGDTYDNKPIYCRDLKAQGAMAALLKDAIKPNLVQTLEGNPAIIHGGPFANIAQGTNSVLATKLGLSLSDYVVTEAGFGADLGAEKFLDIKCGYSGLSPSAVVIVATVRALKYHGGQDLKTLTTPNLDALKTGFANLEKHLENIAQFGLPAVVSINRFSSDSDEELAFLKKACEARGAKVALSEGWAKGGEGTTDLAQAVVDTVENFHGRYTPIYDWNSDIKTKVETVAKKIYGAGSVVFQAKALADIKHIEGLGLGHLPICIAKTQKSFSDNEALIGRPTGFELTVREFEIAAGAGFLVPITGAIMRLPGLPAVPAALHIDIDDEGVISGLS